MFQNFNLLRSKTQRNHPLTTWTWCGKKDVWHGGAHIIEVECAYTPHAWVSKFLIMIETMKTPQWNGTFISRYPHKKIIKMSIIQNHLSHIWYDVLLFILVIWNLFFNLILYQNLGPKLIAHFVGMHVGMNRKTIVKTQTTINSLYKVV